jgi:hypothetical protein
MLPKSSLPAPDLHAMLINLIHKPTLCEHIGYSSRQATWPTNTKRKRGIKCSQALNFHLYKFSWMVTGCFICQPLDVPLYTLQYMYISPELSGCCIVNPWTFFSTLCISLLNCQVVADVSTLISPEISGCCISLARLCGKGRTTMQW